MFHVSCERLLFILMVETVFLHVKLLSLPWDHLFLFLSFFLFFLLLPLKFVSFWVRNRSLISFYWAVIIVILGSFWLLNCIINVIWFWWILILFFFGVKLLKLFQQFLSFWELLVPICLNLWFKPLIYLWKFVFIFNVLDFIV